MRCVDTEWWREEKGLWRVWFYIWSPPARPAASRLRFPVWAWRLSFWQLWLQLWEFDQRSASHYNSVWISCVAFSFAWHYLISLPYSILIGYNSFALLVIVLGIVKNFSCLGCWSSMYFQFLRYFLFLDLKLLSFHRSNMLVCIRCSLNDRFIQTI